MLKEIKACSFDDVLDHARSLGYQHNQAHDFLVKANLFVGQIHKDRYTTAYHKEDENLEARKILKSFMDKHNLVEFYITPKHHDVT